MSLPADHPMHLGYNPGALLDDADVILVIDCDVPWIPSRQAPPPECKVIHIGVDPLFSRYPIRGFACDVAITGATRLVCRHSAGRCSRWPTRARIAARRTAWPSGARRAGGLAQARVTRSEGACGR